jgi:hypothetical protein
LNSVFITPKLIVIKMTTYTLSDEDKKSLKSQLNIDFKERYNKKKDEIDAFIDTFSVTVNNSLVKGNWSTYDLKDNITYSGIYGFVYDFILGDLSKSYYNLENFKPQESVEIYT